MKLKYKSELIRSMNMLSKHKNYFSWSISKIFGKYIFNTLKNIPDHKKIELPVFEDVQMGMSIGLSLNGFIPITCYPRFDFLYLLNQMVNHLDKIQQMSNNQFQPKIIIRTSIGSKKPLDGGPQHTQDYTKIFKSILSEIEVIMLSNPKNIYQTYKNCIKKENKKSYLIIEHGDLYNDR